MKDSLRTYGPIVGIILAAIILASRGSGPEGYTKFYDKNLTKHPPTCLALSPIYHDKKTRLILKNIYPFRADCPYRVTLSTKTNIHCNSNQNSERKALSSFPTSFIRIEIRQGMRLVYSYYVDLPNRPDTSEIISAFNKVSKDIRLK